MRLSKNGIDLIAEFEGFRSKPYLDSAGVATIGYGSTFYMDNKKVTMQDEPISECDARILLVLVANKFADQVDDSVGVTLNQNQFDALVSFTYNLGIGALRRSTLLRKVNANPKDKSIAREFERWVIAGGRVLNGLVKRRKKEAELYFK